MAQPTTQQLAELLIGIARAQTALIQGLESAMPGVRTQHILTPLQSRPRPRRPTPRAATRWTSANQPRNPSVPAGRRACAFPAARQCLPAPPAR